MHPGSNLNKVFFKNPLQNNDSSMNYVVRVMKNRQVKDERKKEMDTSLCNFFNIFR